VAALRDAKAGLEVVRKMSARGRCRIASDGSGSSGRSRCSGDGPGGVARDDQLPGEREDRRDERQDCDELDGGLASLGVEVGRRHAGSVARNAVPALREIVTKA
jgi:hypothetical protein